MHLADLGLADFGRVQAEAEQGVYFISKLPAQTRLRLPGGPSVPARRGVRPEPAAGPHRDKVVFVKDAGAAPLLSTRVREMVRRGGPVC